MLRPFALLAYCVAALGAQWEVVYFHDEAKSALRILALQFASTTRGVATGLLQKGRERPEPVALVTSDGGTTWSIVETREPGISLFFLSETDGWMVTPGGVWSTQEAGRSWTRILRREGLLRVHFETREKGWAIGQRKTVLHTRDGGKSWKDVPEVAALSTNPNWTVFTAIDFVSGKSGVIAGRSRSPRRADVPIWMDPDPKNRRELPSLGVLMQSKDAGTTWHESKVSLFGRISQLSLAPTRGLLLLEFEEFFDYPSEVYSINLSSGMTERCFRRKDFAITDLAVVGDGMAFLVGFHPPGLLARTPVPGKVRIAWSPDCQGWSESAIDYRAVATRVVVSAFDKDHAWAATDTGMILRFKP
jgi:hypothetical protein